jgi:hypothetical protein
MFPRGGDAYQAWYAQKRKEDGRERTRRCRVRRREMAKMAPEVNSGPQPPPVSVELCASRATRISQDMAKEIAEFSSSCLEHYETNIQHLTVQRFLGHSYMKEMIPPYLKDLQTIKLQQFVFSSIREGIKDHLVGVKQSKLVMAKDILCTFASTSEVGSGRGLAGLLGVDRRNISRARGRRVLLDVGQDAFWLYYRHKIRCNILPDHVKAAVQL